MRRASSLAALTLAAVGVLASAGCTKQVEAPTDVGVCWHMVTDKDGTVHFNKLAVNQPKIENCAANLEAMRLRFTALGGTRTELEGAYQGQFLWLRKEGIFMSQTYKGNQYLLLVRTGDGKLTQQGAVPQDQQQ